MLDTVISNLFFTPLIHNIFSGKKKSTKSENKIPQLSYEGFQITNFKGIDNVEIDLAKNGLILLLGLNESGKTTILKAIESFNFLNDPESDFDPKFFQKIRKKSAVGSDKPAIVSAKIKLEEKLPLITTKKLGNSELNDKDLENINSFIHYINTNKDITISRVYPFKNGSPKPYYYKFETDHPFSKNALAPALAHEIISICPFIIYFEDFKDRIPEKIYVNKGREDSYDHVWYDIIDGLYFNTDPNFSIEKFKKFHSTNNPMLDDAETVETRVNKTLNNTFTTKWKDLSGVQEIERTELKYNHHRSSPYFTLKVKDKDGTTYSVDERSKGALWYLSFLMKTEFRSKKMRKSSGKPVFLIDEPASNLHSTAQKNMINDFKMLAGNTSIVYTTHSQYLISTENIKNTYIIEKKDGTVVAQKWGLYLNRSDAQISYYQPLANLLNLIPNTFEVPWKFSVITEGPSDRHVLLSLYRIINKKTPGFAVYPGTSANDLNSLISLNLGWNANFKVILDSDQEGKKAGKNYIEKFNLEKEIIYLPESANKIEKCITDEEMLKIRSLVLGKNESKKLTKKEFASIWAIISEEKRYDDQILQVLKDKTTAIFKSLFSQIKF